MRRIAIFLVALSLTAAATTLFADPIPYPNVGTIAPQNTITATATGDVIGYFVQGGGPNSGGSAQDLDFIRLVDVTSGTTSAFLFNNQTSTPGQAADFGPVTIGDTLVFELMNSSLDNVILASDPAYSADGDNHAYATSFAGGMLNWVNIPAGVYIGMEDEPASLPSDFNYADDTFVFTNISAVDPPTVPEPGSIVLLGTGLLAAAGAIRRRLIY